MSALVPQSESVISRNDRVGKMNILQSFKMGTIVGRSAERRKGVIGSYLQGF
jgi:hypothetical protein